MKFDSKCQLKNGSLKSEYGVISKRWLSTREAAEYLGVTLSSINNLVYRGYLAPSQPSGPAGRRWFDIRDIDAYLESAKPRRRF